MKKKRLGKDDVNEIIQFLTEGKDAKDLASSYHVSVATIYNIRSRMKRMQTALPYKKRGRKPRGEMEEKVANSKISIPAQKLPASGKMENYCFTINGVVVTVSRKAQKIHIAPDVMIVSF